MGDPSLMPYFGVPTVNTATYPTTILIGATSITVTATAYSRVALSMGGTLYGTGIVPAGGSLTLPITPFTSTGTASLVITAQNKITRIENITIAPNSGPYMNVTGVGYSDTNNSVPEYNETGRFSPTFQNVGSAAATNVTATLTCSTGGITITDGTHSIASLASGASTTGTNAYSFTIANGIADGTMAAFTITMVSGTNTWVHNFSLEINAPVLAFGTMTISDPTGNNNGRLDPGETVTITMPLNNSGGASCPAGTATLSSNTSGITINTGSASFTGIAASGSQNLSFSLTAASGMGIGTVVNLSFNATAGSYIANKAETTTVGIILEDFETGTFNSFPWVLGGDQLWTIVNSGAQSGTYAAKSGPITHSQSTTLQTTRILSSSGTLTFWYKVSSESTYDYLKFYIDGNMMNQWSGSVAWTQASYELTAGTHILKWEYMKDGSVDSGSNCAWIDDIIFPASTAPSTYNPPRNLSVVPGNNTVTLNWLAPSSGTPTGYKIFKNSNLLTTVTGLTYTDNAVVNGTSYSYNLKAVYSGGESDATATVTVIPTAVVTEAVIGAGSYSTGIYDACPISVYYKSLHGQSVYTAAELNAVGIVGPIEISQIGFNITGLPLVAMPNFRIKIGHTTATNVSSWITTGLSQLWSSTSYQPTVLGWNMYTLSTPFMWNGTDNIVVDTAFGLFSSSFSATGTVEYTDVTSGYRFGRSDTEDQSELYNSVDVTNMRPNLKVVVIPQLPPAISIDPTSLAYSAVEVGHTVVQQFSIENSGDQALTGSITTPAGYVVTIASRDAQDAPALLSRNTMAYSVPAEESRSFNLSFTPSAASTYNGNVVISSNDPEHPTLNLAVTGSGFTTPNISASISSLSSTLVTGEEDTTLFSLSNSGSQALNYAITVQELADGRSFSNPVLSAQPDDKSIEGSSLVLNADTYLPGTTVDWVFTVSNTSTDSEWLEDVIISFPAGVTVNSVTNFIGGTADMTPNNTSGSGITITWHGETSGGWGVVQGGQSATATVNVTIASGVSNDLSLSYTINGDVYGVEPHSLSGSIVLTEDTPPLEWLSLEPNSGTIAGGASQDISAHFSAIGMTPGTYEATVSISSNDPDNPMLQIPVTFNVLDDNLAPQINLPEGFSFDKNGSLIQSFSTYVSDGDNDPLSLSVSGNSNVLVEINGLSVTFTTVQNWVGSETLTFTVSDGRLSASDNLSITVNSVYSPAWNPVLYPNNPATLYGRVQIEGVTAGLNDVVAAFVGTECRGRADVVMNNGQAYCTLLVNLASQGETVRFRIYSASQNAIYPVAELMSMNYAAVYGQSVPVLLNGTNTITLERPVLTISRQGTNYHLSWNRIPNANVYKIYRSDSPNGPFTQIVSTSLLFYTFSSNNQRGFFKVTAEQHFPFKGAEE